MAIFNDNDALIIEGARTPFGKFLGGLSQQSPTRLATLASEAAITRAHVDPAVIDSVIFGNVLQASADAAYLPRHVGLNVGASESADGLIVSRACGSGLEAIVQATKAIKLGEANTVLAGGSETMSMVPYVLRGARSGLRMGHGQLEDYLMQSLYDAHAGCVIGQTVEHLAKEQDISRDAADDAAVEGQERAFKAQQSGIYRQEIVPVPINGKQATQVETDESLRPDTTREAIAGLPPLFVKEGVITAGNSTGLTDGAAAVIIMSGIGARQHRIKPLGRIVGWGTAGVSPLNMGIGPVPATRKALAMAGLGIEDMAVIELNDAFTVQSLAVQKMLNLDSEKVNPNGGAIGLGHPMGATGTRLIISALYHLRRTGQRYGLCSLCIGGGQGISVILENLT